MSTCAVLWGLRVVVTRDYMPHVKWGGQTQVHLDIHVCVCEPSAIRSFFCFFKDTNNVYFVNISWSSSLGCWPQRSQSKNKLSLAHYQMHNLQRWYWKWFVLKPTSFPRDLCVDLLIEFLWIFNCSLVST